MDLLLIHHLSSMSLSRQRRSGCTQAPIGVRTTTEKAEKAVVSVEPFFAESSRNAKILVAVACLAGLSWFASAPTRSTVPASELAEPYALCTPDGPKIYTVDEHRPNVQCLVVQGAFIVATGNLCECFLVKCKATMFTTAHDPCQPRFSVVTARATWLFDTPNPEQSLFPGSVVSTGRGIVRMLLLTLY